MLDLTKLKPADDSSAEIADALQRISHATTETEGRITEAAARRDDLMTEGSVKEIRKAEQDLAAARLDLDRLKLLDERVREQLEPARERERQAAHDAAVAELTAEIEANNTTWEREIPKLSKAIDQLAEERRTLGKRARVLGLRDIAAAIEIDTKERPSTASMRAEQAEAERRAREEANRLDFERREARRQEWRQQSDDYAARQRAAEEDARRLGLVEMPSPVTIRRVG